MFFVVDTRVTYIGKRTRTHYTHKYTSNKVFMFLLAKLYGRKLRLIGAHFDEYRQTILSWRCSPDVDEYLPLWANLDSPDSSPLRLLKRRTRLSFYRPRTPITKYFKPRIYATPQSKASRGNLNLRAERVKAGFVNLPHHSKPERRSNMHSYQAPVMSSYKLFKHHLRLHVFKNFFRKTINKNRKSQPKVVLRLGGKASKARSNFGLKGKSFRSRKVYHRFVYADSVSQFSQFSKFRKKLTSVSCVKSQTSVKTYKNHSPTTKAGKRYIRNTRRFLNYRYRTFIKAPTRKLCFGKATFRRAKVNKKKNFLKNSLHWISKLKRRNKELYLKRKLRYKVKRLKKFIRRRDIKILRRLKQFKSHRRLTIIRQVRDILFFYWTFNELFYLLFLQNPPTKRLRVPAKLPFNVRKIQSIYKSPQTFLNNRRNYRPRRFIAVLRFIRNSTSQLTKPTTFHHLYGPRSRAKRQRRLYMLKKRYRVKKKRLTGLSKSLGIVSSFVKQNLGIRLLHYLNKPSLNPNNSMTCERKIPEKNNIFEFITPAFYSDEKSNLSALTGEPVSAEMLDYLIQLRLDLRIFLGLPPISPLPSSDKDSAKSMQSKIHRNLNCTYRRTMSKGIARLRGVQKEFRSLAYATKTNLYYPFKKVTPKLHKSQQRLVTYSTIKTAVKPNGELRGLCINYNLHKNITLFGQLEYYTKVPCLALTRRPQVDTLTIHLRSLFLTTYKNTFGRGAIWLLTSKKLILRPKTLTRFSFTGKALGMFIANKFSIYHHKLYDTARQYRLKKIRYSFLPPDKLKRSIMINRQRVLVSRFLRKKKTYEYFRKRQRKFLLRSLSHFFPNYYKLKGKLKVDTQRMSSIFELPTLGNKIYCRNQMLDGGTDLVERFGEFFIPRVRFRPGYQRIWRIARHSLKELLNLKYRYQHRLTTHLMYYRQEHRHRLDALEMSAGRMILSSRLLPDLKAVNIFLTNGFIFVNGVLLKNSTFRIFVNDLIQLIISFRYYILFKWLTNWTTVRVRKLRKLIYRKGLAARASWGGVEKLRKIKSYYTPKWISHLTYDIPGVKAFLEVDYFTLSAYLIYDPFLTTRLNTTNLYNNRRKIYRLYNWKYIN